jgi:hypothetical protein
MTSADSTEFRKNTAAFFREDKLNGLLDITFPDKFIFKNSAISRAAADIAGKNRLEMFSTVPMVMLTNSVSGLRRTFSTGLLKDYIEASFLLYPLFESKKIAGSEFCSGYPQNRVRAEDLFRTDIDSISFVSVNNQNNLRIHGNRVLSFYRKYIEFIEEDRYDEKKSDASDFSFSLDVNEDVFKLDKLLDESEKAASEIVKGIY